MSLCTDLAKHSALCLCSIEVNGTTHVLKVKYVLLSVLLNRDEIILILKVKHVLKCLAELN